MSSRSRSHRLFAAGLPAALVTLWPAVARADMVWPGILLEGRLLSWWAVGLGLVLEAAYLWWRIPTRPAWRALVESAAMNGASAALGLVLIPAATFLSLVPVSALGRPFGDDTSNTLAWIVTLPVATAVNVAIERRVLERSGRRTLSGRMLCELAAVNAVTILLAMASLWVGPTRL